jgi:hypothetical protein
VIRLPFALVVVFARALASDPDGHLVVLYELD